MTSELLLGLLGETNFRVQGKRLPRRDKRPAWREL